MGMIQTATRHEYVGHVLEDAIRNKVRARKWYREHRDLAWKDWEHETNRELRLLFAIRREAVRLHRDHERVVRRAWFEACETARDEMRPRLVDAGDHYAWPA
jgi:hypothetical protein